MNVTQPRTAGSFFFTDNFQSCAHKNYVFLHCIASGYISSTPRVVSSTSNSADVLVNVNEQLDCNLHIIATIANSTEYIQRHPFQTTNITFRGLSPGDTCEISIVTRDDNLLESVGILCNPYSIPSPIPSEFLLVVIIFLLNNLKHRGWRR